jgi:hypothetical protein
MTSEGCQQFGEDDNVCGEGTRTDACLVACVVSDCRVRATASSSIGVFPGPLAGLRLNSTALSSTLLTLEILQNAGG